ncbi:hypothetical protein V6Z12_A10G263100 [Gossypium hirsutum]
MNMYHGWWRIISHSDKRDLEKFVKYVCQAYKGDHKPGACKAQSSSLSSTIHA